MCGNQKFFICNHCGNIVGLIKDKGVPMKCCGEKLTELIPNTAEASTEKHLPEVTVSEDTVIVKVGSVPHPMEEAHHIAFVYVETEKGGQRKCLKNEPVLSFKLIDDKAVAVYAYCNLHGLWKVEL
jgi:superoxide reductase